MPTIETLTEQVQERLDSYVENMRPGRPIEPKDGAAMQAVLWNTIRLILKQPAPDFVTLLNNLLNTIKVNRQGVFNERYVYRFLDEVRITAPERRNFERILNLFLTTCDPQTRLASLRQVSLQTTLSGFTNQDEVSKLTAFYNDF